MNPEFEPTYVELGFGEKVMISDCYDGKLITHADGFWYILDPADAAENFTPIEPEVYSEDGTVLR